MDKALKVTLVQQGVWRMAKESMPLAASYLAAVVRTAPDLAGRYEVRILSFRGNLTPLEMAIEVLRDGVPT